MAVRTSTVTTIGVATLATFVVWWSWRHNLSGITMQNNQLILTGAIPAALFAVVTDLF